MRVTTLASTVGVALALRASAVVGGNIDKDGFTMDGVATYCQGLSTEPGTFPKLEAGSLNRCPILVNITPGATTVHKNTPLEVKFKAAAKFGDIPSNIFPRAIIDQNAKKVGAVTSSFIKWCKAGTNCDKPMDATPFGNDAGTGEFDPTGAKALPSYRVTFTDPGDYILFGQVTLPGDPQLNVSGQQFIAFQKISVVDSNAPIAPSPSPTPSMGSTPAPGPTTTAPSSANNGTGIGFNAIANKTTGGSTAGDAAMVKAAADKSASAAAPSPATELPVDGAQTKAGTEENSGFFASHGALLGAVAGVCVVVLVIGYAVAMRRKNKNVQGSKPDRGLTPTFRMSGQNDPMDDPEPVAYIRKKSMRNSVNQQSLPILGGHGTSSSSTDELPMHKVDAETAPSFDEMDSSYDEGTVTASNKAIPTQARDHHKPQSRPSSGAAARDMPPSSLYDDRDTGLYEPTQSKVQAEEEREFYHQSETWDAAATAHPYDDRDVSMISFNDEPTTNNRRGFEAPRFDSEADADFEEGRISRFNSEASVDSYAFRPSRVSVAESYQSRVSRYSYADSELDRESSRISGMSLYSDRGTNV